MLKFPSMTMFEGRAALQRYIIDEARRIEPDSIAFHFGRSVAQLDLAGRTLRFVPSASGSSSGGSGSGSGSGSSGSDGGSEGEAGTGSGSSMADTGSAAAALVGCGGSAESAAAADSVKYDLLVGADGVNSCVRTALTQQVPGKAAPCS